MVPLRALGGRADPEVIERLEAENTELRCRLGQNPGNSSTPPSPRGVPSRRHGRWVARPGAQAGTPNPKNQPGTGERDRGLVVCDSGEPGTGRARQAAGSKLTL